MKTSLIISTYNWHQALKICLLSVLQQKTLPSEIIIADDGSDKITEELINSFRQKTTVPIHHVWQPDNGFQLAKIRNKAIIKASFEYIIQIDGDLILHKKFIEDHIKSAKKEHFIRGSRVRLGQQFSTEILNKKTLPYISLLNPDIKSKFNGIRNSLISKISSKTDKSHHKILGCNMSYWKEDAIFINGYENDMVGWGHEDEEFIARLINTGVSKIKLKNKAIVYHIYHGGSNAENEITHNKTIESVVINKTIKAKNGILEIRNLNCIL